MIEHITANLVSEHSRLSKVDELFGISFVLRLEPTIYNLASMLAAEYDGAYWEFYSLSNGGFYMAPRGKEIYAVSCENRFSGKLSADALGLIAILYAYSTLSFDGGSFGDICATQYHLVREYMFQHPESMAILRAID